jgi:hypothetical protein
MINLILAKKELAEKLYFSRSSGSNDDFFKLFLFSCFGVLTASRAALSHRVPSSSLTCLFQNRFFKKE